MVVDRKIALRGPEDARELVDLASDCDFDVTLYSGSIDVDAKSIVGVLSMDLKRVLSIRYDGVHKNLDAFIQERAVKE